jgi:glucose-1-phosphate thymidylyltransferase
LLALAGIRDILIISTPQDLPKFESLLGDGSSLGIHLSYAAQPKPEGLAQAFLIGEDFIAAEPCALVLGDNIFYGNGLTRYLKACAARDQGATLFGYYVDAPENFGVVEFTEDGTVLSLEEKPAKPRSNYCVTGLYFYDGRVSSFARELKPSARGELEITDLNRRYLEDGSLQVITLGRGYTWLDTGTVTSLFEAGEFVRVIQEHQGLVLAALEEIAFGNGWISRDELLAAASRYGSSSYGTHLRTVAANKVLYLRRDEKDG